MKCTKLDRMTPAERRASFKPLCEEALLMAEIGHHPNIIALRFVKVSGDGKWRCPGGGGGVGVRVSARV